MPEREAHETEPPTPASGAPATPRVSGEQPAGAAGVPDAPAPESSTRASLAEELPVVSEPSDTLLSAGRPASPLELLLEDRLADVDERLREVDQRLQGVDSRLLILEQKKSIAVPAPEPRHKPWLWIAFLLALIVVFQLLRRVR